MDPPFIKDYDREDPEEGPDRWAKRFDLTNWGFLAAFCDAQRIGAEVIAHDSDDLNFPQGRKDIAAIWDIRVAPGHRGKGIGRRLLVAVEDWSRSRGCTLLKIETQNINVPACRFYAAFGCTLGMFNEHAYKDFPTEAKLVWFKDLSV